MKKKFFITLAGTILLIGIIYFIQYDLFNLKDKLSNIFLKNKITSTDELSKYIDKDVEINGILEFNPENKYPYTIKLDDGSSVKVLNSELSTADIESLEGKEVEVLGNISKCEDEEICSGFFIESETIEQKKEDNELPLTPEDCERLVVFDKKVECYNKLIPDPKTFKDCDQILDARIRNTCLTGLGDIFSEESLCYTMRDQAEKDLCFDEQAHLKRNYFLCLSISDNAGNESGDNVEGICLRDLAIMANDERVCTEINLDHYRDWCNYDLGVILKDLTVCGKIKDKAQKEQCSKEVKKNLEQ